jgi:tetratricopeptide (TPR) repeat protein
VFCALLTACERTGELRRAEEWTRACREFGARAWGGKLPVMYSHCRIAYGTVLCDAGRWPEAETEMLAAVGPTTSACVPKVADAAGALASLRLLQGRIDDAAELLAPYEDRFEVCEPLARLHFARGELDLASTVIARALTELVGDRLRAGRLLRLLVDVELTRGDVDAADRCAERLADYADASDSAVLRADARLADGRVAVARGDAMAAVDAFQSGLDELGPEERPILAAALRLELAHVRAELGDVAAATDDARAAHAIFKRVGAERYVERADDLLERLSSSAPATA